MCFIFTQKSFWDLHSSLPQSVCMCKVLRRNPIKIGSIFFFLSIKNTVVGVVKKGGNEIYNYFYFKIDIKM